MRHHLHHAALQLEEKKVAIIESTAAYCMSTTRGAGSKT